MAFDTSTFDRDPRSYALELVDEGLVTWRDLAERLIRFLSHDEMREFLDLNNLAPDDLSEPDDEEDSEPDENHCDECGDELATDCFGNGRCPTCDGPCPGCSDQ